MANVDVITDLFKKVIKSEKINRLDEENLFNFLAEIYGDKRVLTEIVTDNGKVEYFGCAIQNDSGEWSVYDLIGLGKGVIVKVGGRPQLCKKWGD